MRSIVIRRCRRVSESQIEKGRSFVKARSFALLSLVLLIGVAFIGCSLLGPFGQRRQDRDEDGLSDYEELNTWGTNPVLADTDGDGWDDGVEVTLGQQLNPLVANMPKLELEITSSPSVDLNYSISEGDRKSTRLNSSHYS